MFAFLNAYTTCDAPQFIQGEPDALFAQDQDANPIGAFQAPFARSHSNPLAELHSCYPAKVSDTSRHGPQRVLQPEPIFPVSTMER